jgi:glycolate oxidase
MAPFLREVAKIAEKYGVLIPGCGHIGDGNVHLALFAQDSTLVKKVMTEVLELGILKGGAISGEHGIGTEKRQYFLTLEQPSRLNVLRAIKKAFDPEGLLNPGHLI